MKVVCDAWHEPLILTLLELPSHIGYKPLKFQVVCPQDGTAVLKGYSTIYFRTARNKSNHVYTYVRY